LAWNQATVDGTLVVNLGLNLMDLHRACVAFISDCPDTHVFW
jgi:hypothetical protein